MCKKADVLDAGGYVYDYEYFTYVNKARKALFSHLFIDDHTAEEIEACIVKLIPKPEWQFFVRKPLSPSVQQHMEKVYA
jgi:hypothetical protein